MFDFMYVNYNVSQNQFSVFLSYCISMLKSEKPNQLVSSLFKTHNMDCAFI